MLLAFALLRIATGIVLALYSLPGAELKGFRFTQTQVEEADSAEYWPSETGVDPKRTNGWLTFIDPFHLDAESWLRSWNKDYFPRPVYGGLASGVFPEPLTPATTVMRPCGILSSTFLRLCSLAPLSVSHGWFLGIGTTSRSFEPFRTGS